MFDDLVMNEENKCSDIDKVECECEGQDATVKPYNGSKTQAVPSSPSIKKIHTISGTVGQQIQPSVPTQVVPSAVVLDFDLAKMYMLDCFLKNSALEKIYLIKIADMIEFAVNTQGLNVQNQMDRLKMAEMILAEIFY